MIKLRYFLFLFLLFDTQISQAQTPVFPEPEQVLAAFFEQYRALEPVDFYLALERHPEGYYVAFLENGIDVKQSELFFDFAKNEFNELKAFRRINESRMPDSQLPVLEATALERAKSFVHKKRDYFTEMGRQPYYGYPGWYHDVIRLYENKAKLSDWELNALARAYQNAGSALFDSGMNYTLQTDRFDLPMAPNSMTQAQIDQYLDIVHKELATYKRLISQNPDYITPVGPVTNKYGFEVMDAFLKLMMHQNEATAKSVLQEGLFDPCLMQSARNLLNSCPKDALLLVWGDGDTYPLYYLQAYEGLRKDVVLVNLSLIILPRYLRMVLSGPFGAKPIQHQLPQQLLDHIVIFQNVKEEQKQHLPPVGVSGFMLHLQDPALYEPVRNYLFCKFVADTVVIPVPESTPALKENPLRLINWRPAGNRIFYAQEMLILETLHANNWQRPVCFSLTCRPHVWSYWSNYLALEGYVYRIYPNQLNTHTLTAEHLGYVNTAQSYSLYTETYAFVATQPISDYDKLPFYTMHFWTSYQLVLALAGEGQNAKAKQIARRLPLDLPNQIRPWDNSWIPFVEWLGEYGEVALGEKIAAQIWNNYRQSKITDDDGMLKYAAQGRLINFASKYQLENLEAQLQKF